MLSQLSRFAWRTGLILTCTTPVPLFAQVAASEPVIVTAAPLPPPSVSAVEMDDLGLTGDPRKIDILQPNVSINEAGADSFTDVYAVRGLNNTPNFSKQALTVYVDDVPSASTFSNFTELGQLERVELIRGPQGDFVGKNAEAGVLDVHTITPDATSRLLGSAAVGNYDFWNGNALASGAIMPAVLFAKIEGSYLSRDGYLENTFRDTRPDYQQHGFGRVQLRLAPSNEWEVSFSAEYHLIRDGVQRFVPLTLPDPFRVAFDFDGRTDIDGDTEALRLVRTFDFARLTMITSRGGWHLDRYTADFDYSPAPIVIGRFDLHQTQIAEEIRLESLEPERDWRWRVGIFADRVRNHGAEIFAVGSFVKDISFDEHEHEVALFGRVTRHFDNGFEITGGMRVDYDADEIERVRRVSFEPTTRFGTERSEWNVQPRLIVAYDFTPQTRVYVTSTYGYKNGGYSFLETDPRLATFEPERVWANEIGVRGDWLEHRCELRAAAFVNRIEDYQVERLSVPPDINVVNAPVVVSYGGEVEAVARPFTGFELRGAFGYTRTEFTDFHDPFTHADYSGNRTPFTPDFTAALRARYITHGFFAETELLAAGETFYDEMNSDPGRQPPHAEFNARVGYEDRHLLVYGYVENANDAVYFTQKIVYAGIGTPAPPRTFGAAITIKL